MQSKTDVHQMIVGQSYKKKQTFCVCFCLEILVSKIQVFLLKIIILREAFIV
jgi:hypothetical protein